MYRAKNHNDQILPPNMYLAMVVAKGAVAKEPPFLLNHSIIASEGVFYTFLYVFNKF